MLPRRDHAAGVGVLLQRLQVGLAARGWDRQRGTHMHHLRQPVHRQQVQATSRLLSQVWGAGSHCPPNHNAPAEGVMNNTLLASVFSQGRFVGSVLHRGCKGFEAVAESGESHGCFPSQKEAAAALQQIALHASCCGD
jgi:hypothetical protein